MKMLRRFLASENGATAIEYGLIATLVSVAIIGGATALGTGVNDALTDVSNEL